ncbi:MAG TPA: hypothetical protein VK066_13250 [Chloroflexota bacterium]|nr:hypothetical protein [Chloroflexota bacterium]
MGSVTEEQGVLIMACNYTGSVQEVFSRAPYSSGRALLTIAIPGAGSYFTPTGRAWLPRDWAYFQDTGNAHALDPAPLTSPTGCPAFDAAWMGHIVYQATVGLPDVTWSVWAGPDGTACWQRS